MTDMLTSDVLGELARFNQGSVWVSAPVPIPMLGGVKLSFGLSMTSADHDENLRLLPKLEKAARAFLALPRSAVTEVEEELLRLSREDAETNGDSAARNLTTVKQLVETGEPGAVWRFLTPRSVGIFQLGDERTFVELLLECAWRDDHVFYSVVFLEGEERVYAGIKILASELLRVLMKEVRSTSLGSLKPCEESDRHERVWESGEVSTPLFDGHPMRFRFFNLDIFSTVLPPGAEQAVEVFLRMGDDRLSEFSEAIHAHCMEYFNLIGFDGDSDEDYENGLNWREEDEHISRGDFFCQKNREVYRLKNKNDIWRYLKPQEFKISIKKSDLMPEQWWIQIDCFCYHDEHGILLTFINGRELDFDCDPIY